MAEEIISKLKDKFSKNVIRRIDEKSPKRIYVHIEAAYIVAVVNYLFHELGGRFAIATGTDTPEGIQIFYHFAFDKKGIVVSICVLLDRAKPEIETTCIGIKATEWIEREIHELLGVNFRNHPDLRHLLLCDDWPEGDYPLRRK